MDRFPEPGRDNPFQEEEDQDNEQRREAPGVRREYQGENEPRAPGAGQEHRDQDQDSDRKIA